MGNTHKNTLSNMFSVFIDLSYREKIRLEVYMSWIRQHVEKYEDDRTGC